MCTTVIEATQYVVIISDIVYVLLTEMGKFSVSIMFSLARIINLLSSFVVGNVQMLSLSDFVVIV